MYNGSYRIEKTLPAPGPAWFRLKSNPVEKPGTFFPFYFPYFPKYSSSLSRCKTFTSYFFQYSYAILISLSFFVISLTKNASSFFNNTPVRGWAGLERFLNVACCPYNSTQMMKMTMSTYSWTSIKRPPSGYTQRFHNRSSPSLSRTVSFLHHIRKIKPNVDC